MGGEDTGSQPLGPADERALAREGTPSAQMRKVELSEVVREALDVLGEDQKMAVLLNKFEDMSYAEIAEVMGRSRGGGQVAPGPGAEPPPRAARAVPQDRPAGPKRDLSV